MSLKLLKLGLGSVFLISLASVGAIIVFIDPAGAKLISFILFSAVLFLALFSLFSWIGILLRNKFISENNYSRILKIAFREGALISILGIIYLWLSHFNIFKIWIVFPALFLIVGIEYYFLIYYGNRNKVARG